MSVWNGLDMIILCYLPSFAKVRAMQPMNRYFIKICYAVMIMLILLHNISLHEKNELNCYDENPNDMCCLEN